MREIKEDAKNPMKKIKSLRNNALTRFLIGFAEYEFPMILSNLVIQTAFNSILGFFSKITKSFTSFFNPEIHLTAKDEAFYWVLNFLSLHQYTMECSRQLQILPPLPHQIVQQYNTSSAEKDKHKKRVNYIPLSGSHTIPFTKTNITINYDFDNILLDQFKQSGIAGRNQNQGFSVGEISKGTMSLSCYGRSTETLKQFIDHVQGIYLKTQYGKTVIYVPDSYCDIWESKLARPKRSKKTLILSGNLFEQLYNDALDFLNQRKYYEDRGCPFRRGYLLHGPPGTGKTSTILALAGALDLNICMLNVTDKHLSDDKLTSLLLKAPQNSIILLEDIDHALRSAFTSNSQKRASQNIDDTSDEYDDDTGVSYSGLLNSIDGVIAQEGRILFMTTNHIEKLPKSLIRPGRIDMIKKIDYADDQQCEGMFLKFYEGQTDLAKIFVSNLNQFIQTSTTKDKRNFKITPAALQGYFLQYKSSPEKAVQNISQIFINDSTQNAAEEFISTS